MNSKRSGPVVTQLMQFFDYEKHTPPRKYQCHCVWPTLPTSYQLQYVLVTVTHALEKLNLTADLRCSKRPFHDVTASIPSKATNVH